MMRYRDFQEIRQWKTGNQFPGNSIWETGKQFPGNSIWEIEK
jgi:hypothetical protein